MTLPRCVILDDYQDAALRSADWSVLEGRVRVEPLREHLSPRNCPPPSAMPRSWWRCGSARASMPPRWRNCRR
ncbi:hypothetical protein ACFQU7_23445 [Pseudoroseomonas wenyumeiae]